MALFNEDSSQEQNGTLPNTKESLEKIKQQLFLSGRFLLQGFLLKRSETLRKWNQRWFTLDPTTGKMEYRIERGDDTPKGVINYDAEGTIIISPINVQGLPKYDGCCIYIQNTAKKEYFLCAETQGVARAWVSTLQAAQLVLRAHKEAVNSLGGSGSAKLGTVAAVVAAANATAKEAAKEIAIAFQTKPDVSQGRGLPMDDLSIMKETLRVKDEELHQMAKEVRARDATVKELAERLSETAEAAEAAASAAQIMDKERRSARTEISRVRREVDEKLRDSSNKLKDMEERLEAAERSRDEALREAHMWRAELAKEREHAVVLEAALLRENVRQTAAHPKLTPIAICEEAISSNPVASFANEASDISSLDAINLNEKKEKSVEDGSTNIVYDIHSNVSSLPVNNVNPPPLNNSRHSDEIGASSIEHGVDIR